MCSAVLLTCDHTGVLLHLASTGHTYAVNDNNINNDHHSIYLPVCTVAESLIRLPAS